MTEGSVRMSERSANITAPGRDNPIVSDLADDANQANDARKPVLLTFRGASVLIVWVLTLGAIVASLAQVVLVRRGILLPSQGLFLGFVTAGVCLIAATFDAASGRVPNTLTLWAVLIGFALNLLLPVLHGLGWHVAGDWLGGVGPLGSLKGFAACGAVGLLCMLAAGMGGGDVKLLAGVGALLGMETALRVLCNGLIAATLFALVNIVWTGRLNNTLRFMATSLMSLYLTQKRLPLPGVAPTHVPLAVPLLIGLVIVPFWSVEQLVAWLR
ncbi:MAG: hypothetical protein GC164_09990 [Phycisphaera sp.]|nr:hypothetical protein [Phycisphaera sp.]